MTCIVAIKHNDTISMACDSAAVGFDGTDYNGNIFHSTMQKVFVKKKFILGCTSSFKMIQILQYHFIPPVFDEEKYKSEDPVFEYLIKEFIVKLKECFSENGFLKHADNGSEYFGEFLLGFKNRIFAIYEDLTIMETSYNYAACGCGMNLALGSLYSTQHLNTNDRLKLALEAAQEFNTGVREPFIFKTL